MENLQNQNSQNNLNQLPQQNPKKNIPSWLGFTIIIVVAFLLFGGVFGFQYFVMKSEIPNPKSETNSNIQNSNTQNETAGWKTYKNDEYGFEFKYPSTYKSQEIPIGTPTGLSVSLPRGAVVIHEINNSIINIDLLQRYSGR